MAMALVDILFMVEHLMIKIFQESIPVQGYFQWQIVDAIQIQVNFLLH